MSDFDFFAASVTRTELGLNPLDVNDHQNYILGGEVLGGQTTWSRQSVKSPYVDGEFTVNRTKSRVEERFSVQVLGDDHIALQASIAELIAAFSQHRFSIIMEMGNAIQTYDCEAADYTVDYASARWMSKQVLVNFMVPRQPTLLAGGW